MPLKNYVFLIFFLIFPSLFAFSSTVTLNMIHNRFEVDLPHGDIATVYLNMDKTFIFIPAIANQDWVHNCWGKWKFEEDRQLLHITKVDNCKIMDGTYRVDRKKNRIVLRDGIKMHVFKHLVLH